MNDDVAVPLAAGLVLAAMFLCFACVGWSDHDRQAREAEAAMENGYIEVWDEEANQTLWQKLETNDELQKVPPK